MLEEQRQDVSRKLGRPPDDETGAVGIPRDDLVGAVIFDELMRLRQEGRDPVCDLWRGNHFYSLALPYQTIRGSNRPLKGEERCLLQESSQKALAGSEVVWHVLEGPIESLKREGCE